MFYWIPVPQPWHQYPNSHDRFTCPQFFEHFIQYII
ncbi:Uncharacterised protein [Vibrio cholerae]|nr:Uncharacterised protein [Vibrio cholerae]